MSKINSKMNFDRLFLSNNDGQKLLNENNTIIDYYNKYSSLLTNEGKIKLITLMKMEKNDPVQYKLAIKALVDNINDT